MKMAEHLLWLAGEIQKAGSGSPVMKRRAVSTGYYAVFHAIASLCAQTLLPGASRTSRDFERVYRGLEHGVLKNATQLFPENQMRLRHITSLAAALQKERNKSDYSPARKLYSPQECNALIEDARKTIELLKQLNLAERRTLAVSLLIRNRPV
jgi:hypothetical protein